MLAFVQHYRINGSRIPCMDQMMERLPTEVNEEGYFGPLFCGTIHEQQLSGHSWLLRGLCEHYEVFQEERPLAMLMNVVNHLYLPTLGRFSDYPIQRDSKAKGDVSGSSIGNQNKWILSSDTGCAFMSIDGLSHAYKVTGDARIKSLLDEMITVYLAIDKVALKAQTHCTLTAARGMLRMYQCTGEDRYWLGAADILNLYVQKGGMTATYQNLNWWGCPDSWTEPCAIVDSLMVALELYKITKEPDYRSLAARIYHNGLATAQRDNGGAGTDCIVLDGVCDTLAMGGLYEAYFCCTMRLAEGLRYVWDHDSLLYAELEGQVTRKGRAYMDGDLLYAEISEELIPFAQSRTEVDGHLLCPIVPYYRVPKEIAQKAKQTILFS